VVRVRADDDRAVKECWYSKRVEEEEGRWVRAGGFLCEDAGDLCRVPDGGAGLGCGDPSAEEGFVLAGCHGGVCAAVGAAGLVFEELEGGVQGDGG